MTSNDTLRVGDHDVPLTEIEQRALRPGFRYAPEYEGCAVVILSLVAECRRLRAVEASIQRMQDEMTKRGLHAWAGRAADALAATPETEVPHA